MPLIDNYLLDNYAIDGPSISTDVKSKVFADISGAYTIPALNTNLTLWSGADFEAGTKLITIHPYGTSSGTQMSAYSLNTTVCFFALIDSAGTPWYLMSGNNGATYSICSISIDLVQGKCYSMQTSGNFAVDGGAATSWYSKITPKPAAFKADTALKFVFLGTNSATSSGNVSITLRGFQADWV